MANRQTLKNLITSVIFDNLLRKITAPKHQELELLIMDSVVIKEDDIINDFSSNAADKVASAGTVKILNDTTLKLGRVQTTTAWLDQSNIPEGDYDVTFENAGQNLFGYTHFKVSIRYLNLGTEYIQLLESVDGRKFRRSNVLNVYGDFEEVTVGEGSGITSVVAGENVEIDYADPKNPRISFPGGIGTDGVGIVSIAKTGTVGLVDTYTITYTDETTSTYTVTNGSSGTNGRGIVSITRTSGNGAAGTTDTYTILFTDNSTTTFNVVNGSNGTNGTNGTNGSSTETAPYVLSGLDADIKTGVIGSHTILEKHQFTAADIYAEVTTMPEVLGIVVDVLKNGVSIFSTKPSIAAGALHSVGTHVLVTSPTIFNAGDIRSISVDQMGVGDGKTGKNLKLSILMHKII